MRRSGRAPSSMEKPMSQALIQSLLAHRSARMHAQALAAPSAWLVALCLVAAAWLPGAASAASPTPPADVAGAAPALSARIYVTVPGDTLERVVHKTMASSPLRMELLRQALVAANPDLIPADRNPRIKPGTALQLPDHDALVRSVLLPLLQPFEAAHTPSPADGRRKWVRYP